ncbi:hypothetical protein AYI68_g646 [Smittium mucronatum]|uniref:Uncharacterized protein n=1 Tax=Smittium mucronatum TaxID=133383 RepID=A0A1R0H7P4_9FUNG|nr:hypothetical protein AYI68_g646 [Smittium mucronatum]
MSGISFNSAMGMIERNHELVESGGYPYGIAPEVDCWRELAEDRDSEASSSIFTEALNLSEDLEPSVNLTGEPVMEDIVSSLLGISLSSDPNPLVVSTGSNGRIVDRRSKGEIPALKSLLGGGKGCTSDSIFDFAPPLAAQQQFRIEDLYQSNWYRNSASDNIYLG